MSILTLENISFQYEKTPILHHINMEFEEHTSYAIVGPSGAGKTTLLSLLAGLTKPQEGNIYYEGKNLKDMNMYDYRSHSIGVIFQSFNLLTKLTALENVILSMDIANVKMKDKKTKAMELLKMVGLNEEEMHRRILKLSGGQQQRVAIARALSYDPKVILADEPTGNLDSYNTKIVLDIFKHMKQLGKTIVFITHDQHLAKEADRIIYFKDGEIVHEL